MRGVSKLSISCLEVRLVSSEFHVDSIDSPGGHFTFNKVQQTHQRRSKDRVSLGAFKVQSSAYRNSV